jgi:hypothetical protein
MGRRPLSGFCQRSKPDAALEGGGLAVGVSRRRRRSERSERRSPSDALDDP